MRSSRPASLRARRSPGECWKHCARLRVVSGGADRSAAHAETAVDWLRGAGLRIFEITMTIPGAAALIGRLAADPYLLIGAGTVPDAATARACLDAGARFLVAPWVDPSLADPCRAAGASLMLGALTPTEVRAALAAGADVVKVFPGVLRGRAQPYQGLGQRVSWGGVLSQPAAWSLATLRPTCPPARPLSGWAAGWSMKPRIAAGDRAAIEAAARAIL